jgi:hypothetical protein
MKWLREIGLGRRRRERGAGEHQLLVGRDDEESDVARGRRDAEQMPAASARARKVRFLANMLRKRCSAPTFCPAS